MSRISEEEHKKKLEFLKNMLGKKICAALEDDDITEIMLNDESIVWVESRTRGQYEYAHLDEFAALNFLYQLSSLNGLFINADSTYIETILPFNKERIEATIPPTTKTPSFTIRKPAKVVHPLEEYLEKKIITKGQFDYICEALVARKNILVSGGPGTGKTTLTNAIIKKMSEICDSGQRIIILEDTNEICCVMKNRLSMITSKNVSMTDLLKIAMRSRPDRILVGEVRDAAALDLLKAWNTGCPGGIATIHANSSESSVLRILSLAQEANVPPPFDLVAETLDVLINIVRDPKQPAGRKIQSIAELTEYRNKQFVFKNIEENEI